MSSVPIEPAHIDAANSELRQIPVDRIKTNPENPRIIFRQEELDELLDSINRWGVQVPITVYKKGKSYVLIDGERRWRCSLKLNRKTIPALVQSEPDRLTNILLMFNIHALREQWDLLTIALKLKDIISLLGDELKKTPSELSISAATGLKRGVIRRCRYLLNLPAKYHAMILKELSKPKRQQKFTEDFFIEMEKALRTVERAMPEVIPKKDEVRQVLIKKFRDKVIDNRVHFRDVARIARAENVDADPGKARRVLRRLFARNTYSIRQAFDDSVAEAYSERDILTKLNALIEGLRSFEPDDIDQEVRQTLRELVDIAQQILEED